MKIKLVTCFLFCAAYGFSQEIKRISKSQALIIEKNKQYINAIQSSKNPQNNDVAYKNKDSLFFLKELANFFDGFEKNIRSEEGSQHFISNGKKVDYVLFVSNTGYTDAFFYDFEDGKLNMSFAVALQTYLADYKWENLKKARYMHSGRYTFK